MSEKGRHHLLPLLVWTAVWAIFFAPLLLGLARLPNGDFAGQFHAFGLFQMRQLAAGHLPLWSPGSFSGFPFAADTQSATFYPLRWLTLLLSLPGGFSYYLLTLEGLLHIWLAGLFTYMLAFDMTRQRTAALIAAIAFGLGGYLTSYPLLQLAVLETVTWLPLVLLLLRRGVLPEKAGMSETATAKPFRPLAAAGVVLGMAALVGHPQTLLHISYLSAAYYLFLTTKARWKWGWRLGLGSLMVLIAVGTALIALLPAWFYLQLTTRSDVGYAFISHGFPLLNYMHLLVPRTLSLWTPEYVGLVSIALVLLAFFGRTSSKHAQDILFWGVVAAVAAWASLGDRGILFQLIYRIAPGFALFRQQERLVNIVSLSLALLAAQGFALWWQLALDQRRILLKKVIAAVGGGLLLFGIILAMANPIANADWLQTWVRQLLLSGVTLALLWFAPKSRVVLLLVGVLAFDLFVPVRTAMQLQPKAPDPFWPQPTWLTELRADNPGRIDTRNLFTANVGEIYDVEDVRGISPLKMQQVARFENLPRPLRWQLLNVTHVVAQSQVEPSLTAVTPITQNIMPGEPLTATLYLFEDALPRAWMSYQPLIAPDAEAAFQMMKAPAFDPAQQVVLTEPVPAAAADVQPPDVVPTVETRRTAANVLSLSVETAVPGILVVSEWAVPGWQVSINGTRETPLTANYGLMGVPLAAGRHEIVLRYTPPGLIAGAMVTAVTLLLTLLAAWRRQPVVGRQTAVDRRLPVPDLRRLPNVLRRLVGQSYIAPPPRAGSPRLRNGSPSGARTSAPEGLSSRGRGVYALSKTAINRMCDYPRRLAAVVQARWRVALLLIIFVGFGLRLAALGAQELRGDEAFSYLFARMPVAEIIPALLSEGDPHSPLHYLLLHGWMALAGDSEPALRFVSMLPGVLLLPLLYQLGRRIGGKGLALWVMLVAAVSPSHIWLSQDVRNQYTLGLLFIVLAALLLVRLLDQADASKNGAQAGGLWHWLGWGGYAVICALAVYSHYYAAFALLGHGVYIVAAPSHRRHFWKWAGAGVVALLLFVPWVVVMLEGLLAAGQLSDPATPELANYLTTVGIELLVGSTLSGGWLRWLFLIGLALVVLGARQLWRTHAGWAGLLLTWLVITTLFIYLIRFSRATFNPFYITIAAPAWWLLLGAGVQRLWQLAQGWGRETAVLLTTVLLIASGVSLRNYFIDPAYSRSLGYRPMAAHVTEGVAAGDLFLAHFPDPSLVYYLRNTPVDYTMQPSRYKPPAQETAQELADLAAGYERIWFVPAPGSAWDAENVVPTWLDANMLREQAATYNRLNVSAYRPAHAVEQVAKPINLQLDNGIGLEAVYISVDGRPVDLERPLTLSPGSQVDVTLIWQADQPIDVHTTVFVQLLDESGLLVAQDDNVPAGGLRPTVTWQPEETVIDAHTLTLPPDRTIGQGRMIVGMYETETVERLLFTDGSDAAVVATVLQK